MEKPKTNKKLAREEKLREQKIEEQILKVLEEGKTPEGKFRILLRKYVESECNNRYLSNELRNYEKQMEAIVKEKDSLQREYNKNLLVRDKLSELCREQQKLIKSVKNESMQKIREEEEKRKESQMKFQTSLNEITQSLNENNEENNKLREHNLEITNKLKFLADQYQEREQDMEKLNMQLKLEAQLHQAKLNKHQVETAMQKEILIKEKQIALEKLMQSQKLIKDLSEREQAANEQLSLFTAKYDDFENSFQKSNAIFETYKVELEKMMKNTRKCEKESLEWKRKWEKSNATLIELATEKKERDDHAIRCNKQIEQLHKLLRTLQAERTNLYNTLKEHNIQIPPLPVPPPEPEKVKTAAAAASSSGTEKNKMEMMSRSCAELKVTLANLQKQVKYLNLKEAEGQCCPAQAIEQVVKKKGKRKQKSKKNSIKENGKEIVADVTEASSSLNQEPDAKSSVINQQIELMKTDIQNGQFANEMIAKIDVEPEKCEFPPTASIMQDANKTECVAVMPEIIPEVIPAETANLNFPINGINEEPPSTAIPSPLQ